MRRPDQRLGSAHPHQRQQRPADQRQDVLHHRDEGRQPRRVQEHGPQAAGVFFLVVLGVVLGYQPVQQENRRSHQYQRQAGGQLVGIEFRQVLEQGARQ